MTATAEKVRERPILFSGDMVRAILDGRKTQTRRVVKPQPPLAYTQWSLVGPSDPYIPVDSRVFPGEWALGGNCGAGWMENPIRMAYGEPGDRLWVRETWSFIGDQGVWELSQADPGNCTPIYRADGATSDEGWFPSIHMPRWASRLTLEITEVRVQRVQDITAADAMLEGHPTEWERSADRQVHDDAARDWYMDVWDSLNAKRGYPWTSNPWVWVLTFRRIEEAA
jgi:hypothetical protein